MKKNGHRSLRSVILLFFFFSGASSLAYEVIWTRQIAVLLGNTVYVISMVLAAFMAGLAGGSLWIGRWVDRRADHLRIYGVLEIAVALYCLALPRMISHLVPLFRAIYVSTGGEGLLLETVRAVVVLLLLLIPSVLMGGTLPVLSKLVGRAPGTYGADMGGLYAANTLGAVVGVSGAGFFFIPRVGVGTTLLGAAAIAIGVGILSLVLNRSVQARVSPEAVESGVEREADPGGERETFGVALVVFAVSGFAAMAYEVVWIRLLTLFIGPSTYAFTIVIAAFISGLALGSMVFRRYAARFRNLWLTLGLLQVLVGLGMVILMSTVGWVYDSLRDIMALLKQRVALLYLAEIGFSFGLLLVPTLFSGGVFPVVFQTLRTPKGRLGRAVGGLYAGNSIGAVLGSLVAGFAMVPALGIRGSLRLTIAVNLVLGLLLFLYVGVWKSADGGGGLRGRARAMALATVGVLVLALLLPGWSTQLFISPPYMVVARGQPTFDEMEGFEVLYYKEGVNATVVVLEGKGLRWLSIEGKPDASAWSPEWAARWARSGKTAPVGTDMRTQVLLGQVPMFCAPIRSEVLVIGLASGVTVGSVFRHPDVRSLVCAEIASEVVEASRYFSHANYNIWSDPRLEVVLEDGRNHLLMNPGRYDVIISEPSNPWMPGSAKLFSREAFGAAAAALTDDGLMCTWIDSYSMQPSVMQSLVRSFSDVFPYVVMFQIEDVDYCLIGTRRPLRIHPEAWRERMQVAEVREDLERVSISDWTEIARMCVATTASLRQAVRNEAPNTDDNARVEFHSPLTFTKYQSFANWSWIDACAVSVEELFDDTVAPEVVAEIEAHRRESVLQHRRTRSKILRDHEKSETAGSR